MCCKILLLWLWWPMLPPLVCAADTCAISQSFNSPQVSPVLESLQCYNDYESYFHCMWKEERNTNKRLQLWFAIENSRGLCEPNGTAADGTSQCRYKTKRFSIKSNYTAYFKDTLDLCSSTKHSLLNLSLLLRAQAPVNLTTSKIEVGGRLITWSSPYPESSSLNRNITYKLSYRPHGHDNWTTEELAESQKHLEKKLLIPGHRYEARVKARVSMGQWSHWTHVVSWYSELDPEQVPRVDCVVLGEKEAQCSWEQSTELVHFIRYQLVHRPNPTATAKVLCEEPVVSHRHDALRYSCLLRVTETSTLELVPTRIAKTFSASKYIRPYPATQVKVTEKGHNWVVEWTPPKMQEGPTFYYEVFYYSKPGEEDSVTLNISVGSTSVNVLGSSLLPSQNYKVKVRTLLVTSNWYDGPPSDWSLPVEWTSHKAVWSISNWIYISVAFLVSAIFFTLYWTIPACQRRTVVWMESVPSPGKSKVMLDIQTVNIGKVIQNENTYICKVLDVDSVSTCSSNVSLWRTTSSDEGECEADEGIWSCDNLPVDTSAMSFTGPYILCQSVDSKPVDDSPDQTEVSCPEMGRPAPVITGLFEEGYVCLPGHAASRSMQDLTSQRQESTDEQSSSNTEEDPHCVNEPCWPQGGAIEGSGYFQLPADFRHSNSL